jgi:hypothetical protein
MDRRYCGDSAVKAGCIFLAQLLLVGALAMGTLLAIIYQFAKVFA